MKPPFGDYHKFSSPALDLRLKEPKAIVVKSPVLLQAIILLQLVPVVIIAPSVQKRHIYDITSDLEGIGLIEKKLKNRTRWKPGETDENAVTIQSDADYWLLLDADVSITDLWRIMYHLWTVFESLAVLLSELDVLVLLIWLLVAPLPTHDQTPLQCNPFKYMMISSHVDIGPYY
ncbi:hypothetical protein HYC85_016736 [Camellia sinensis]|uniref:E2F/DP family winged-helix DNA-binding domain-containing protein n=1 Tax=Camellia sinensis TaxID=4442 RepID=A0A7J7H464_CAMSI|nr:hypothetical protein HYC85_016736 [Camellia sinensis]